MKNNHKILCLYEITNTIVQKKFSNQPENRLQSDENVFIIQYDVLCNEYEYKSAVPAKTGSRQGPLSYITLSITNGGT